MMATLYIKAEFCFLDNDGEIVLGKVSWIKADWEHVSDIEEERMEFAHKVAEDYLKTIMSVKFDIIYLIALKKPEIEQG